MISVRITYRTNYGVFFCLVGCTVWECECRILNRRYLESLPHQPACHAVVDGAVEDDAPTVGRCGQRGFRVIALGSRVLGKCGTPVHSPVEIDLSVVHYVDKPVAVDIGEIGRRGGDRVVPAAAA